MKIGLVIIISLIIYEITTAQVKYGANWVFGSNARVDFSDTSLPVTKYEPCFTTETSAAISDSLGNLLLYITSSDSDEFLFSIRDSFGNIINNGDSINTNTEEDNGACFIPVPRKPGEYYLFHLGTVFDEYGYHQILEYSYVILDSAISQYVVTKKNIVLDNTPIEQRMAFVKHANGIDWWLFVHGEGQVWYSFRITEDSIIGRYSQAIGVDHNAGGNGCMTFSPSGRYMGDAVYNQNTVELFDFDRCTGLLSNCRPLYNVGIDTTTDGIEFSLDETKLYVTIANSYNNRSEIYEYNVAEDTSLMQKQLIWSTDSLPAFTGDLQIAPDNRIYIAVGDRSLGHCCPYSPDSFYTIYNQYLWRINVPDSLGTKCNLQPFALYLGDSSRSYDGLPNMPNFNLGPLQTSIWQSTISNDTFICTNIDTPTKGVFISVDTMPGVMVTWQSAPGIENINATRQLVDPTQSTWYYVTFIDTSLQGTCTSRIDSVYVQVLICDTLGIQNVTRSNEHLTIYPNPAQDVATIEWQPVGGQDCSLAIYDLLGRQISDQKVNGMTGKDLLNISDLSNGMYVVKLYMGNGAAISGKLVVVR